jgi:hypothetical protein
MGSFLNGRAWSAVMRVANTVGGRDDSIKLISNRGLAGE